MAKQDILDKLNMKLEVLRAECETAKLGVNLCEAQIQATQDAIAIVESDARVTRPKPPDDGTRSGEAS